MKRNRKIYLRQTVASINEHKKIIRKDTTYKIAQGHRDKINV